MGFYNIPAGAVVYCDYMARKDKYHIAKAKKWALNCGVSSDDFAMVDMGKYGVYIKSKKRVKLEAGKHNYEILHESCLRAYLQGVSK